MLSFSGIIRSSPAPSSYSRQWSLSSTSLPIFCIRSLTRASGFSERTSMAQTMSLVNSAPIQALKIKPESLFQITWRQIRKNRLAIVGFAILAFLLLVAIFAPSIAPYNPYATNYTNVKKLPSAEHFLGTDELGRDVFSRLIYGTQISLVIGLVVVSIAMTIGVPIGAIAGYYGGSTDLIIMRIVDIFQSFPFIVLAIAIVAVVGPSLLNMMFVLGGVTWVSYARLVRGMVLSLREEDYIMAARALGAAS